MTAKRVALGAVVLLLVATPAAAHGNYVSADDQVSADGTVRLELVVIVTEGYVVLHADADGEPGAVVGHRGFGGGYVQPDYAVQVDPDYWENRSGNVTLWAVLHRDTGDRRFDPADDPPIRTGEAGTIVADRFTVRRSAAGPVNVIAERDHAQATDRNRVQLRAVRLATDGYVVVRANAGGAPGRIVGTSALPAGEHANVTVTIDEAFYEHRPERFTLWAVVHASDGDDAFDPATDIAVTAGGERVMTRFTVERTDPIEHTSTRVPAETDHTETVTETDGHDHEAHAHTETASQDHEDSPHDENQDHATTAASGSHDTADGAESPTTRAPTTAPGQPGFGLGIGAVAVLVGLILGRRRPP